MLCARAGYTEKHLLSLGMCTAAVRRLRYLELPSWAEIAPVVGQLCQNGELSTLERMWRRAEKRQSTLLPDEFGSHLHRLRKQHGIDRRELADLFGIGGKKPARIIKYIEEDGFYSAQAYPAGLAALLAPGAAERAALLAAWRERRTQFHRRHRPETRFDLRLARELYGFEPRDMEPILGYSSLEYQKIERRRANTVGLGLRAHPASHPSCRPTARGSPVATPATARSGTRGLAASAIGAGSHRDSWLVARAD